MAKKGNSRGKGNTSPTQAKSTSVSISADDVALLEKAKSIAKDGEIDRNELKSMLEDELVKEIEEKRQQQETELESQKASFEEQYKKELDKKHSGLKKETVDLEKTKNALESSINRLQSELDNASKKIEEGEAEKKCIIEKAKEEAQKIVDKAKEDAEDASKEVLDDIVQKKLELEDEKDGIETQQLELEAREVQLASKEKRIEKQAAIYDAANPDVVESLNRQLNVTREQLDAVRDEYEKVQIELNKIKLKQIKSEGISPEELQEENDRLLEKIEDLENKCKRYSDYELLEMKRALDAEKDYLTRIQNQDAEIAESKAELVRLKNGQMEYEQLRSQLDLLRTLNDHLRGELDNTKKMLESSVGEICPALTAIDIQQTEMSGEEYNRSVEREDLKVDLRSMNLPKLITHVKTYAAGRAKPLYYSDKDLRAYIAGMASSHLSILQGMSGTGKTSLPKIFAEAILGEINVVAVESSWRDRNELLGYYNDFSKKFTAKEFTCDLYRAGCDRYKDTIYIIVLDEMNLSRVEYYFADFLSVLEDKTSNWKIKLVDTDLRQLPTEITKEVKDALANEKSKELVELKSVVDELYSDMKLNEDEETKVSSNDKLRLIAYLSGKKFKNAANTRYLVGGPQNLIDGNTVKIPANLWFVGTANRDESTFEITDKVYDRAQVLEFNKRAKGNQVEEIEKIYLPYETLNRMFKKAEADFTFDAETYALLNEIEQILQANFKVSYGNRILDQMNTFVPVYVAAGQGSGLTDDQLIREAIDYQLTYKVLRKLEYIEMNRDANKDAGDKLRKKFEQNEMKLAKEFMDWKLRGEE
ncbi:hypothetical protein SAMN02745136_03321 [Anaerocolumna jejuensis DSM 15929]|uniref:AAA domain (Dynein-related subfamily) n=1 Tax=Anaerocolumna jejuensis DSM 15929 TaxID=1121322 RepID=A0A1M6V8D2_9FIRM|nr:hypothetical protein [Anaerocolumna jejuensis]SHK77747.1 hypothetical protein SAMN02745136_03321 [Anaerocolumna jejuensis DSM 15929]